jgi:hypothetical protein
LFVYVLAVYDSHFRFIPSQELHSFLTLAPDTAFHFHSNHTLQHPAASENTHFHFASFIHFVFPKPFPHAFPMVCFSFLRRVCPINRLKAERKTITPKRCVVVRSANIRATIRPHHPLVVQKIKNMWSSGYHVLAVYAFIQAHYIPGTTFVPHSEPFHFMHTPQHRTASVVSFLSIPQAPLIQSVTTQALFQCISSGMFLFSA